MALKRRRAMRKTWHKPMARKVNVGAEISAYSMVKV
jgi:hypothetical protein